MSSGSARPIHDAAGTRTGAMVVFRDVTEAIELQHQLAIAEARRHRATYRRHRARLHNMLTVITGTIEILAMALPTGRTCTQSPG